MRYTLEIYCEDAPIKYVFPDLQQPRVWLGMLELGRAYLWRLNAHADSGRAGARFVNKWSEPLMRFTLKLKAPPAPAAVASVPAVGEDPQVDLALVPPQLDPPGSGGF